MRPGSLEREVRRCLFVSVRLGSVGSVAHLLPAPRGFEGLLRAAVTEGPHRSPFDESGAKSARPNPEAELVRKFGG